MLRVDCQQVENYADDPQREDCWKFKGGWTVGIIGSDFRPANAIVALNNHMAREQGGSGTIGRPYNQFMTIPTDWKVVPFPVQDYMGSVDPDAWTPERIDQYFRYDPKGGKLIPVEKGHPDTATVELVVEERLSDSSTYQGHDSSVISPELYKNLG